MQIKFLTQNSAGGIDKVDKKIAETMKLFGSIAYFRIATNKEKMFLQLIKLKKTHFQDSEQ